MTLPEGWPSLDEVPPAADVLVAGPPLSGKDDLALRYLASRAANPVVVTARRHAEKVADLFVENGGDREDLAVVDCAHEGGRGESTVRTSFVGSPTNLTAVGVQATKAIELGSANGSVGVAICSLSDLLTYHEVASVNRFIGALRRQLDADGFVVGVLNASQHDDSTVAAVTGQFESIFDTRTTEDGREVRIRDKDGERSKWRPF
jgi:hypothetical protein